MDVKRHLIKFGCSVSACVVALLISVSVASENAPAASATTSTSLPPDTKKATTPEVITNASLPVMLSQPTTTPKKPAIEAHIWNLQNADIHSIIDEVSRETGKNFLVDPRVNGKVSLVATKPLPPAELYQVFLSILSAYGFSAVTEGNVTKILPNTDATQLGSRVASIENPGKGDEIIVRVIPVNFVSSTQLVPILRPMLPQWSNIAAYAPTNALIATGTASNIDRIVKIVEQIDQQSNGGSDVVTLHYANAKQVVTILKNLQNSVESFGGATDQASVVADTRTNAIIISGTDTQRLRTHILITQLDTPSEIGSGSTQVIFLHYLNAKKLAPILDKVAKGESSSGSMPAATSTATASTETSGNSSSDSKSGDNNDDIGNLTAVLPEEDTNALVITASAAMMTNLKNIIQELDVRPAEVYVQAIIVELDADSMEQLGIQWGTFDTSSDSSSSSTTSTAATPTGAFQGGTGVAVVQNGRFLELLAAIKGMSGANILSQPTIMVLDNKKAVFSVGQQISIQSQSMTNGDSSNSAGLPVISANYQQQDVGLKLEVKPQVDQDDTVQLDIKQSNGSLQNPDNPSTTPVINQSEIQTSVMINSGDILILGGLMSNSMTTSTYSTPFLSSIPIIGGLFTYHQHELTKKDLMVFMRPVIVHSPLVGSQLTNKQYTYMRDLQKQWNAHDAGRDEMTDRLLPPRANEVKLPIPFKDVD